MCKASLKYLPTRDVVLVCLVSPPHGVVRSHLFCAPPPPLSCPRTFPFEHPHALLHMAAAHVLITLDLGLQAHSARITTSQTTLRNSKASANWSTQLFSPYAVLSHSSCSTCSAASWLTPFCLSRSRLSSCGHSSTYCSYSRPSPAILAFTSCRL